MMFVPLLLSLVKDGGAITVLIRWHKELDGKSFAESVELRQAAGGIAWASLRSPHYDPLAALVRM